MNHKLELDLIYTHTQIIKNGLDAREKRVRDVLIQSREGKCWWLILEGISLHLMFCCKGKLAAAEKKDGGLKLLVIVELNPSN